VFRSSLAHVAAGYFGDCQNERDGDVTDTSFAEDQAPAAGDAFFYLVTGSTDDVRGPAGFDSRGRARDHRAGDCV